MEIPKVKPQLRFERQRRAVSRRLMTVGVSLALFTLLWLAVPPGTLYWLLLTAIGVTVWVASYGWRQALRRIHDLIHDLGEL